MEQFYFLSIVANSIGGLVLVAEYWSGKASFFKTIDTVFKNIGLRMIFSLVVALIALIKLIWPYNGIPVLGDLIPAASGLAIAFILVFDYMRAKSEVQTETMATLDKIFLRNKFLFGIGSIVGAFLHFLFFPAIFF